MDDLAPLRTPAPPPTPNQLAGTTLLVVDDDLLVARAWARALRKLGATIVVAGDVPSAIRSVRQHARVLDVILLDYVLIGGDAIEVVAAAASAGCPCGIVLVTGHGPEIACSAAARLRVDDVLLKPVATAELVSSVDRARAQGVRRRTPVSPIPLPPGDQDDLAERVLQAIFSVLRRAGLQKDYRQQALEGRARGVTDEEAAAEQGVTVDRLRGQVCEALRDLGVESGFELVRVIADRVAYELARYAESRGLDALVLLKEIDAAIASVIVPSLQANSPSKAATRRPGYRVHRPKRQIGRVDGDLPGSAA
jgi:CheY-like chemotaxis protein